MHDSGLPTVPPQEQTTGHEVPPFLSGIWSDLSAEMSEALRHRAAAAGVVDAATRIERVRVLPLPFFPRWVLCDLFLGDVGSVEKSEVAALAILYGPDGFTPLEDPASIASHIETHGIDLTRAENCLLYTEFAVEAGALGAAWRFRTPCDDAPIVNLPRDMSPSALDAVRSPEAAQVRLGVFHGSEPFMVNIRLSVDGEMMILGKEKLTQAGQRGPGPRGPMRVSKKREDSGK